MDRVGAGDNDAIAAGGARVEQCPIGDRDGVAFDVVADTASGAPTIDRLIALRGRKP